MDSSGIVRKKKKTVLRAVFERKIDLSKDLFLKGLVWQQHLAQNLC